MTLEDAIAGEIAKAVTASVAGAGITAGVAGAKRLSRLVRRKTDELPAGTPTDVGELSATVRRGREDDPEWGRQTVLELAKEMPAGPTRDEEPPFLPPIPFCDRDELRDRLPENGIYGFAGLPGCGKTALVERLAVDHAERFPTYYRAKADLDRYRMGDVLRIAEVKRHLLRQWGIKDIASADPELSEQYQRVPLIRRALLVVENVRGADELNALIENWPAALVLVTTRRLTEDLRACPPRWAELDGLDADGARELLASRCPELMIDSERAAADALLDRFGRQPQAIWLLGRILTERADEPRPIAGLLGDFEQTGIRETDRLLGAVLDGQVGRVPGRLREAFRLLALCPAGQFTVATAAVLLDVSVLEARGVVGGLRELGLLEVARGRFRMSWSIRRFAAELGAPAGGDAALDRLLAHYASWTVAADLAEDRPGRQPRMRYYPLPRTDPWPDDQDRIEWLDAEADVLAALVEHAYLCGRDDEVGQLCGGLEVLSLHRGRHELCLSAYERGVRSAQRQGASALLARQHALCGRAATLLHRFDWAASELDAARGVAAALAEPALTSSIWEFTGRLAEERTGAGLEPGWESAIDAFRRALAIDRGSDEFARARGLHARMLANVMVKAGRVREASELLGEALAYTFDDRNASRVYTVWAKCDVVQQDLRGARENLERAQQSAAAAGADQYRVELEDLAAEIEFWEGRFGEARSKWAALAQAAVDEGHPRAMEFFAKLNRILPGS